MGFFTEKESGDIRWPRLIVAIVFVIVALSMSLSSFAMISAGHRGVVMQFGAVENRVLGEGFNVITPYMESVVSMDVRTQKYEVVAAAATKDLLDVTTTVAVNYHLSPNSVNEIYQEIGIDYESTVIAPAVQEVTKQITARFNAEQLINQRPAVKQEMEEVLKDRLANRSIIVETISIVNLEYPTEFNDAIKAKQTAVQDAIRAQNKLEQIKFEAQQAVAKATGDAQAIDIINQQLLKSPQYIQYLAVNKWDGKLPQVTSGLPFIQIPMQQNSTLGS